MADFLKMDIFFATTTVVVFLLGVFALAALYYAVRILKSLSHIAENVSAESDIVRADLSDLRAKVKSEGMKWRFVSNLFSNMAERSAKRSKKDTKS